MAGCPFRLLLPRQVEAEGLLPSFRAFRVDGAEAGAPAALKSPGASEAPAPAPTNSLLFEMAVGEGGAEVPADGGELLDVAENDMGITFLYRLPGDGGYSILLRCSPQGPEHAMLADSRFRRLRAAIRWDDPYAGIALSSLLRIAFSQAVLRHDGIALHAAAVVWRSRAYLFMGKSGTGKSTHARQWLRAFPGSRLLNDDNPILRMVDGVPMVWGSPWSGKTPCYHNAAAPVAGIVRLCQAPGNRFLPLADVDALTAVLPGCSVIPSDVRLSGHLYATLSAAVSAVPVGILHCLPDVAAARLCAAALGAE